MLLLLLACKDAPTDAGPTLTNGPVPEVTPAAPTLRRLTTSQYHNAIVDLLGPDVLLPTSLEPDIQVEGLLSVGAGVASVSSWGVERYESAAISLAEQAVEQGTLTDCDSTACVDDFVADFGRRAWRRPLTEDEVSTLAEVIDWIADDSGDFETSLVYGTAAMLQSPHFLYRKEHGSSDQGGPLSDFELATRLSFFVWNTTPDEELLDAAEAGELSTDAGLEEQARRLMEDERAVDGVRNLFTELYTLYALDDLDKDPLVFTHASADLGPAAREETLLLVENLLLHEGGDFRDLFTSERSYVDRRLASLYRVGAPSEEGHGEVWFERSDGRRGLLGHASVLAQYSHATGSSPTLRGKFLRTTVLCHTIPPPPGDVDTTIPEADNSSPTMRDRIAIHLEDPACASCHSLLDPIGLGLENFDGIGRWRDTENGETIDASGDLDGAAWETPWEMAATVRNHPDLGPCFTTRLYDYAVGRPSGEGEEDLEDWLAVEFEISGYAVPDLMLSTVMSPGFRNAGAFDVE